MSIAAKLLGIALVGRRVSDSAPIVGRLMSGVAAIIGLAMMVAILSGLLLIGLLFASYQGLVAYGLQPEAAMLLMAGVVLLLILGITAMLASSIKKLRFLPLQLMEAQSPVAAKASRIGSAFIDGLMDRPSVRIVK